MDAGVKQYGHYPGIESPPRAGFLVAAKDFLARTDAALERGLKSLTALIFQRNQWQSLWAPRSRVNYLGEVGDGTGSSTVTAPLFWVVRTFPEAPPALWRKMDTGEEERILTHPLLRLLERPNEFYTGINLWAATVIDYQVNGNAYWAKLRNGTGAVTALWWIPSWLIAPKDDDLNPKVFVDHYLYRPGGREVKIDPLDIVHFRFGLDSNDPRVGLSPLQSVLREVFTDDEAAQFTASLLRNMGVPGLIVSPKNGSISPEAAAEAKSFLVNQFTGDRRGDPLVQTGPTEIQQFGFSPEQLLLRELRRIPEERVTAVMGIPAIVAGLGAGLDRSTFTNMGEAREAAYEAGIIPMQRNLGEDVRFQLLRDFGTDPYMHRFGFDLAKVRVLQEDLTRQAQRHDVMIRGGWERVDEGRRAMGLEVDDSHKVFLRPLNTATIAEDGTTHQNGNGTGDMTADDLVREIQRLTA